LHWGDHVWSPPGAEAAPRQRRWEMKYGLWIVFLMIIQGAAIHLHYNSKLNNRLRILK
jgi:hypothetical protein